MKKKPAKQTGRPSLHYAGEVGGPFGWGVFGKYMTQELEKLFRVQTPPFDCITPDVCLIPLANPDLHPVREWRGRINLGVAFFESELGPKAAENCARFDAVFVGSTWCNERLKERGIHNGRVLIQGVDQSIFYPRPRKPDGQFRIFSGGKFEWRKGQDIVIRAFAQFAKDHPEAHLVCSWFNPWPALAIDGAQRAGLTGQGSTLEEFYADMMVRAGIPSDRFTVLPQLSHAQLAEEMAQTDCGLFPNRCEGGTNLVLMEYAACGRSVIANKATGHSDVSALIDYHMGTEIDENGWAQQKPEHLAEALRLVRSDAPGPRNPFKPIPTWQAAAQTVAEAVNEIARQPVAV